VERPRTRFSIVERCDCRDGDAAGGSQCSRTGRSADTRDALGVGWPSISSFLAAEDWAGAASDKLPHARLKLRSWAVGPRARRDARIERGLDLKNKLIIGVEGSDRTSTCSGSATYRRERTSRAPRRALRPCARRGVAGQAAVGSVSEPRGWRLAALRAGLSVSAAHDTLDCESQQQDLSYTPYVCAHSWPQRS